MKGLALIFLCVVCLELKAQQQAYKIVVLGSSTAYGTGASPREEYGWTYQYEDYLKIQNPANQIFNLAVRGYTSYKIMPDEFLPPTGVDPSKSPEPENNITKALSLNPDAIIINLPSNDIDKNYTLTEFTNNLDSILSMANNAGVICFITTTQPRNFFELNKRDQLIYMRDTIQNRYKEFSIDFWSDIAVSVEEDDPERGEINGSYDSGDGVHLNNAGHTLLAQRTIEKDILGFLSILPVEFAYFKISLISEKGIYLNWETKSETDNDYFSLERGANKNTFLEIAKVKSQGNGNSALQYDYFDTPPSAGNWFYRIKQVDIDGKYTYFPIVQGIYRPDSELRNPYPNPTNGLINLPIEGPYTLAIYNSKGVKVFYEHNFQENIIDLRNYSKGIYTLQYFSWKENKAFKVMLN